MSKRQVHVMCTPLVTGAPSAKEIASAIFSGTTPCASNVYEVRPQLPDYQAHFETRWMWGASARVSYLRTNTIPRISQGGEECMSRVFAIRQISMAKMEGGETRKVIRKEKILLSRNSRPCFELEVPAFLSPPPSINKAVALAYHSCRAAVLLRGPSWPFSLLAQLRRREEQGRRQVSAFSSQRTAEGLRTHETTF